MCETNNRIIDSDLAFGSEEDYHLRFFPPDELEIIRSAQHLGVEYQDYCPQPEFSYLKEGPLNLEDMGLTDRQLMAVSLVFYGGIKKKLAARIMKISSQALSDHIKAGLKKMGDALK
ncbi:MAG: hypothetical protein COW89_02905 [Nitrospinae bacterium CG22_combo_CG10-13_8_21_14_all_47_10]|jgi:hypothetical protein|nr:MAG: hypothetical protein COW89_02905 [Nitrospinae bacterium CG22_combo_CG10-13_8_21_14_all_47_10]